MKRYLQLFITAFFCLGLGTSFGQIPLIIEDFEDGTLPTGWARSQATGSDGWEFGITSYSSTFWDIPAHPDGGMFTAANDDDCNCDASMDELMTPVMDWTSYDSVIFIFDAFYDAAYGGIATIGISFDGGSTWTNYGVPTSTTWQENLGIVFDPAIDGAFTSTMMLRFFYNDDGVWADGFAVDNVVVAGYRNPCDNVVNISGCDVPQTVNLSGFGDINWDFDECWATPGEEQLYSFTAPSTGIYTLNVQATNSEWVDYLWKPQSDGCDTTDWSCISDVLDPGYYGGFSLTAGEQIYIIADAEGLDPAQHVFSIVCPCGPITLPSGTAEAETCGDSINDGCNLSVPVFGSIDCGDTILGNTWADGGSRDTDWYEFTVTSTTDVTVEGQGDLPLNLFIVDNCNDLNILAEAQTPPCSTASATVNLTPGTYYVFVGATGFNGYPCGGGFNNYWVSLDLGAEATITANGSTDLCSSEDVTLTANPGVSYSWSPNGETTQSITVSTAGTYSVTVTDDNGCSETSSDVTVTVNSPDADFTYSQNGLSVDFTDASTGSPIGWEWDFDDGSSTETAQNPSHTFTSDGTYTVTLVVEDANGCTDTTEQDITIMTTDIEEEIIGLEGLDIFPNPTNGNVTVAFAADGMEGLRVELVNIVGQKLYTEQVGEFSGNYRRTIDLDSYTRGSYILQIFNSQGMVTKRIIRQ